MAREIIRNVISFEDREQKSIQHEIFALLYKCLQELPDIQREVYLMRYASELKPKEFAKLLKIPVKTVNQRLYRAKLKIEEKMREYGYE